MSKKINLIFIIIFLILLISTPIIVFISKDKKFSENENRYLAQKPQLTFENIKSGNYFKNFENYINDQFIFRELLYSLKTQIQILAGNKDINGVYLTQDNYLIEKKLQKDFNENNFYNNIDIVNNFCEKYNDKNINFMIVPTASLIFKDKLPKNSDTYDQNQVIDKLKDSISNGQFIDLRSKFMAHNNEYLYYKTDHHWTSLACFYAYEEWCKFHSSITSINNYNRKCITSDFKGSLYSKVLNYKVEKDEIEIFIPHNSYKYTVSYNFDKYSSTSIYDLNKLKEKDKYQVFCGGNYPELKIKTENSNGKNLLIIKDSFANEFLPFLVNDYENISVIDLRYFKNDIDNYINSNNINEILFLYNIDSFSEDTNLKSLL